MKYLCLAYKVRSNEMLILTAAIQPMIPGALWGIPMAPEAGCDEVIRGLETVRRAAGRGVQ